MSTAIAAGTRWPFESRLFLSGGLLAIAITPLAAGALPATVWIALLAAAVTVAGLPHGALDPWVARRAGVWRSGRGCVAFHAAYVAVAAAVGGLWLVWPAVMLALFLAYAAWHFAADWDDALGSVLRLLAGVGLIGLPAVFHEARVAEIFGVLAGSGGAAIATAIASAWPLVIGGHALAAGVALSRSPRVAVELGLIAGLAFVLPPLAFFAVYFCLLHSMRHLRAHLAAADQRRQGAMLALGYTLATVVLAGLAWYGLGRDVAVDAALLRVVFIGLAALTVPHMMLALYVERVRGH